MKYKCPFCDHLIKPEELIELNENKIMGCKTDDGIVVLCQDNKGNCMYEYNSAGCKKFREEFKVEYIRLKDL